MSFYRFIYYAALGAGWAAWLGWLLAEVMFFRQGGSPGRLQVALTAGLIGALVGLAVNELGAAAQGTWRRLLQRAPAGLLVGALGGVLGAVCGDLLYAAGLPRATGWLVMGLGIGAAEGIYEGSPSKIRNGLIGGGLGGLVGGLLFDPIQRLVATASGSSGRATAFVLLGLAIGLSIGLVHVALKQAWLTVLDGYRSGRQLVLTEPVTPLGRGDHLPLPLLGPMNQELEAEHARIQHRNDGSYWIEDCRSRLGTRLNNRPLEQPTRLADGDLIRLGTNILRFNQRRRNLEEIPGPRGSESPRVLPPLPPPPPPPGRRPPATTEGPTAGPPRDSADPAPPPRAGSIPPPPPPPRRPPAS